MMYSEQAVSKIAIQYSLLNESLEKLRDARKNRAVLGWVSKHYIDAQEAMRYLQTTAMLSGSIKEKLQLGKLEEELINFGNTPANL